MPRVLKQTVVLQDRKSSALSIVPNFPGPLRRLSSSLLITVLFLVAVGILMVQSASQVVAVASGQFPYEGLLRQSAYAMVGLVLMVIMSQLSTARLRRLSWLGLMVGFTLQILVYTPLGYEAGGNRNWLGLGPISMQPAEFMKVVFLVWVSTVLANKRHQLSKWWQVVIPVLPVVGLSMAINVIGGDLGTLMILAALVFGCLYFSRVPLRFLAGIAAFGAAAIGVMTLIKPNRVYRVTHFFEVDCVSDPEQALGMCWQTLNGLWALANGGVFGTGLGNGKAKWSWLPEADTDFIFAIIGEELGLIGAAFIILLFTLLSIVLLAAIGKSRRPFTRSVLGGMTAWIGAQMMVNVSVVLGFVPVLGVPLPFISAGGTSLVSLLMAIGVVLACLREEAGSEEGQLPEETTEKNMQL